MAMKNSTLATPADATEISVNPKMPAMTAMMANMSEYLIMPFHRTRSSGRVHESGSVSFHFEGSSLNSPCRVDIPEVNRH